MITGGEVLEAYQNRVPGRNVFAVDDDGTQWGCLLGHYEGCPNPREVDHLSHIIFFKQPWTKLSDKRMLPYALEGGDGDFYKRFGDEVGHVRYIYSDYAEENPRIWVGGKPGGYDPPRIPIGLVWSNRKIWSALNIGLWNENMANQMMRQEVEDLLAWHRNETFFWAVYYPDDRVMDTSGGYIGEHRKAEMCEDIAMAINMRGHKE